MKKIVAVIMVIISIVVIPCYGVFMLYFYNINLSFKDLCGDKSALKDDKIIMCDEKDSISYLQYSMTKHGVSVERIYEDVSRLKMDESEFKENKNLYRGLNNEDAYEDDKYKIVVNKIDVDYEEESYSKVTLSYKDKTNNMTYGDVIVIANEKWELYNFHITKVDEKYILSYMKGSHEKVIFYSIDFKNRVARQERILSLYTNMSTEKCSYFTAYNDYLKDDTLYIIGEEKYDDGKIERNIYAVNLKNYTVANYKIDSNLAYEHITTENGKIIMYSVVGNKLHVAIMDLVTKNINILNEISMDKEYNYQYMTEDCNEQRRGKDDDRLYVEIIAYRENRLYVTISRSINRREMYFVAVIDHCSGERVYECFVEDDNCNYRTRVV